jgi:CRP/FNR family cyclic AMP-dependent transcriptional regulator
MSLLSNVSLLRRVPIFASLAESQINILENSFVKRKFRSSSLIFRQGDQPDAFFAILIGRVHVLARDRRGKEVIFNTLKQGDYFGEMSLIDGSPHSTSVKAVTACELLMIDRAIFQQCMPAPDSPEHRVMLSLVSRLRAADKKIESLALLTGKERVFEFLKEKSLPDEKGNRILAEKISATEIARNVGASRELVTRMIKSLKDDGSIVKQADGTQQIIGAV